VLSVILRGVMALRDAIKAGAVSGGPVRPPNLRMADGGQMCASCRYYRPAGMGKGVCRLYGGFPVRPQQVSDSFSPRS
jgi:hypothetical protein